METTSPRPPPETTSRNHPPTESIRDTWCTPKPFALKLGRWDLDPCSNERSHILARRTFRLDRGQDGLALAKRVRASTRTFLNVPFSRGQVERWWSAYRHVRWCFLLRFDPRTSWFECIYDAAGLIAVPPVLNFEPPPGVQASSNVYPHALFYRREEDATTAILDSCFAWRKKPR